MKRLFVFFFFFQAEDGIRDLTVTGVQTCALPISATRAPMLRYGERQLCVPGRCRAAAMRACTSSRASSSLSVDIGAYDGTGVRLRSEERRVGKECRCRWSADH